MSKLERVLSSDEVDQKCIRERIHQPSFIRALKVLGPETAEPSKLSAMRIPNKWKVDRLLGVQLFRQGSHVD